jgi:nucleoside-diphosphate-sugar epimerase
MRALVTGASGFLGGAIARRLRADGHAVVTLQRSPAPELEALGIRVARGDIADPAAVHAAAAGCEVVFHVAAKAGHWGPYAEYHAANVLGTQAVIDACRAHGIGRLVHTSTPSVVHAGGDLEGIDESAPVATRFHAHYPATKAEAERRVLAANGPTLATVALRPHLIWGPGDRHLLPRIVARAKAGRLRFVGPPGKRIDTTWIDNAVDAHLAAAEGLAPGAAHAGRAYFISNGEPIASEDMINRLLDCAGLPPERRRIPYPVAFAVGALMEAAWTLLPLRGEPLMTRFLAEQLSTAHWYDISAAARDFGWRPRVSLEEGFRRLKASLT